MTQLFGALMAVDAENVAFAYLFTIGLSLQGVLILYFHLFRKEKFQTGWKTFTFFSSSKQTKLNLSRSKKGGVSKARSANSTANGISANGISAGISIHGKEEGAVSPNPIFMDF